MSIFHAGINIDLETDLLKEASEDFVEMYQDIREQSVTYLNKILDPDVMAQEHYKVPSFGINGKR